MSEQAKPASAPSEQKPVFVPANIEAMRYAVPITWTTGPNVWKDWCSQWFGPDSDDDYLAMAVFNLPPMAQRFKESAPQTDYKAQRDELMEVLGIAQATINCAGISTPKIVCDAVEKYAAIASVKGGE